MSDHPDSLQHTLRLWLQRHPEISQRELSRRAGLGDSAIKNILTGASRHPRIDTLRKLAAVMDLSLEELAGDILHPMERLRLLREKAGISIAEAAETIGMRREHYDQAACQKICKSR